MPTRAVATKLGILPQSPVAPEGITVADLVGRGRYPHQGWFRQWTTRRPRSPSTARSRPPARSTSPHRPVDELSGGQRQRVWIAMTLAQGTGLMLLDEPTTYLDLSHQVDILDLLVDLNQREGRTIVLVLHDLNQACRYAHHLIAMREGAIVAEGAPATIVTPELVTDVFGLPCRVIDDPVSHTPMIVPIGRHLRVSDEPATPTDPRGAP